MSYSPLFDNIIHSSLWLEEDFVVKVFLTMIAKQDADHVVKADAFMIGRWSNKSEVDALKALAILEAPDTKRLVPQLYEGRRIEKVEGGWLLLNGAHYQELMQQANRRAYKRKKEAEYRAAKKKPKPSTIPESAGANGPPDGFGEFEPPTDTDSFGESQVKHPAFQEPKKVAVPEPKTHEIAQNPPGPRPALVSTKTFAEIIAAKKAAGIPVAAPEAPVGEPERPVRRTVLDPGQPARPKAGGA